ncbi:hypothetical protein N7457_008801 [Penicillium paradoxum]|uniref:uncharacterized protein n=1 Tax=Penicillium paradoxum TaxID=176176 RepID=UPI00254824BB|nr:uncharacterized protein N7457_008801 [Penicillium paradoxum]KAJ5773905.1 hypothetical protein N7457_008801 [Penicillium paradoxum]
MSLCYENHDLSHIFRRPKDAKIHPCRKRIIICCDGTWQSAVSGKKNVASNVTRLCRALNGVGTDDEGNQWQQIVWYDSGIGTTSGALGKQIEGAIGQGLEGNVIEAYNFCVLNYNPGDQIMCFGFSRGAFTARAIAGLISDIGICRKQDLNQFPNLWKMYKKNKPGERFYCSDIWFEWMNGKADENQGAGGDCFVFEKRPSGDWAQEGSRNVEVVGVFDTVGAIGMPEVLGVKLSSCLWWSDRSARDIVGLSPNIKHAFQALALDEHRNAFSPTLWYLQKLGNVTPDQVERQKKMVRAKAQEWDDLLQKAIRLKDSGNASDEDVNNAARKLNEIAKELNEESRKLIKLEDDRRHQAHPRTLRQVWFPGYHINIGGGSDDSLRNEGDMEEMSNITFAWMLDQIRPYLSLNEEYVLQEREAWEYYISKLAETSNNDNSWGSWVQRKAAFIISAFRRPTTSATRRGTHRTYGWGTGHMQDSFTPFYYLNGSTPRTPGRYDSFDKDGNALGESFEYVHPVVGFRQKQLKDYTPIGPGVRFNRREAVDEKGHPTHVYDVGDGLGCKTLPEWRLGGVDSYERLAITSKAAYDYIDELDLYLKTGIKTARRSVWGVADIDLGIESSESTEPEHESVQEICFRSESFRQSGFQSTCFEAKGFQLNTSAISYKQTVITP